MPCTSKQQNNPMQLSDGQIITLSVSSGGLISALTVTIYRMLTDRLASQKEEHDEQIKIEVGTRQRLETRVDTLTDQVSKQLIEIGKLQQLITTMQADAARLAQGCGVEACVWRRLSPLKRDD